MRGDRPGGEPYPRIRKDPHRVKYRIDLAWAFLQEQETTRLTRQSARATLTIEGAAENNLRDVTVSLPPGTTAVVGVSGSGKSSLVFDTLYHESRRRFLETLSLGSPWLRMPPARLRAIHGLAPAVSLAQNVLNRNPNSTVATAIGVHPFLRVAYARFAERRCPACGTETVTASLEEQLATLRQLTTRAQGPVRVIAPLVRGVPGSHAHLLAWLSDRFDPADLIVDGGRPGHRPLDPDRPHDIGVRLATVTHLTDAAALAAALDGVVSLGSAQVLLRADGTERWLSRARLCPGCGRPFTVPEPEDFRTGRADTRASRLGGRTLDDFLSLGVDEATDAFALWELPPAAGALRRQVERRLAALHRVDLGYLALDRPSPSLSRGEGQRLRIALLLASPIDDVIHVLDEPSIGLDPAQVARLLRRMSRLRGRAVMVEHDPAAVAAADHVIELGPGAGGAGGRVVAQGTPSELWRAETPSGRWFSGRRRQPETPARPEAEAWLTVRGASVHNLAGFDAAFPLGRLTVVSGPSGAGKSSLVREVLVASLEAGRPAGCRAIDGPHLRPITVTQEPIGVNPRSNPATYSGLAARIRARFAAATGEPAARFSFNRGVGACEACGGIGSVEIRLPYLPSEWLTCEACQGRRFRAEVLGRTIRLADGVDRSIADVYALTIAAAAGALDDPAERRILEPLVAVGLGYLSLGRPSPSLSGGEAQRVKLAKWLAKARSGDLVVLDEPTTGLHPADLARLIEVLDGLVERGCTVVVIEHQADIVAAADWLIHLGPGAGPSGGRLVGAGVPAEGAHRRRPIRPRRVPRRVPRTSAEIRIEGARANNLRSVSVAIAKGQITGVVGVSGSGKSSLVRDVLEAEATRRFVESLSMYERQSVTEGPEPQARRIEGLGPTISIRPERRRVGALSTVGTATEVSFHLSVLLAHAGRGGAERHLEPRLFSPSTYEAACLTCHGVGTIARPRMERLIVRPDRPLCGGAMYSPGYYPQGYLCRPPSYGYWMLRALGERYGFDPAVTPWSEMSAEARHAFLEADEEVEIPPRSAGGPPVRTRWRGFFRIVAGWDLGGMYTDHVPCPSCGGGRLRPEYLAVRLDGMNRHELHSAALDVVEGVIADVRVPRGAPSWVERSRRVAGQRLGFLRQVGLAHLHLDRLSRTLSAGEAQRVKLASLLGTELGGMTVLLDEPTRGLHPREVDALGDALCELRDAGNGVLLVDHDPRLVARVDRLLVLGPEAGDRGGRLLASGSAASLRRTRRPEVRAILSAPLPSQVHRTRRTPAGEMVVRHPTANNLSGHDVAIPLGVMTGLCGVSGSGKSTLAIGVVARVLAPARLTTSVAYEEVRPGAHAGIDGAPLRAVHSNQSRSGVHTPGAFLGVTDALRRAYAASGEGVGRGLTADDLVPGCDACHGRGRIRVDMGFLPAIHRPCDACGGTGYRARVRELVVRGGSLPDLAGLSLSRVRDRWGDVDAIARPLDVAMELGLGYLRLGQAGSSLSGGEAQRLRLARELARPVRRPTLFILDEPTVGLHSRDVGRLVDVLDGLVERGHSILIVEHDPILLACCDWLVELGPGGGPDGGRVIAAGTPEEVARRATPTAPYLREVVR